MNWINSRAFILFIHFASLALTSHKSLSAKEYDLLIRGGTIVDGSGKPRFVADLAIRQERIDAIGDLDHATGKTEIDATGKIVAPGFIDMMGQTATPMINNARSALNLLSQGITTINAGEGVSAAPLTHEQEVEAGYTTMREYFHRLDSVGLPVNVVQTVGHTQVRRAVLGDTDRRPSETELDEMKSLVQEAMEAGAIGLSSALIYPPAVYARTKEISSLASVAGASGGRYFTHMRNEGDRVLEALEEALTIGRDASLPVHIFHLKAAGENNWNKMPIAVQSIRQARKTGQTVTADIYPYVNNGLGILAFIHPRHFAQGRESLIARLDNPDFCERLKHEIETTDGWENWYHHVGKDWNRVIIGRSNHPKYASLNGHSLAHIAKTHKEDPWTTFFQLASVNSFALPKTMSEDNKKLLISQPFVSYCTDVGPAASGRIASHPRSHGAFPRLLRQYVIDGKTITLEKAISNATSKAAKIVFARQRGEIREGWAADLVVFDESELRDLADFKNPQQLSEGIHQVVVNGEIAFQHQKYTGSRSGKLLRGPGHQAIPAVATITSELDTTGFENFSESMQKFLDHHEVPGASVAVTNHGKLVYSAGFGYADLGNQEAVKPTSLFRIASISKPITAVAILQLVEKEMIDLDDKIFDQLAPSIPGIDRMKDPRCQEITIRHLLEHRGGWDRSQSFDAMFQSVRFAEQLNVEPPAGPWDVIRAMINQPLDHHPGSEYAYSNYGYCLLGRLIETLTHQSYEEYVREHVLSPLGIKSMRIGATQISDRRPNEVRYYHPYTTKSVFSSNLNADVPSPYGGWFLEAMDSHGGWIASAEDLARFAAAFDNPDECPILSRESVEKMYQRPTGKAGYHVDGRPKDVYYSLGWSNRVLSDKRMNHWHSGSLPGTATIMIRRHDGKNFVGLLNTRVTPTNKPLGGELDRLLHKMVNEAPAWAASSQ